MKLILITINRVLPEAIDHKVVNNIPAVRITNSSYLIYFHENINEVVKKFKNTANITNDEHYYAFEINGKWCGVGDCGTNFWTARALGKYSDDSDPKDCKKRLIPLDIKHPLGGEC